METELFMECEEEELEPWQQVDDCVEEDDVDFMDNYGEPVEDSPSPLPASETPPPRTPPPVTPAPSVSPPIQIVSSTSMPPPPPRPLPPTVTSSSSVPRFPVPVTSTATVTATPLMAQAPPLILTQTAGGTFLLPAAPGGGSAAPILLTTQMANVEHFRFEDDRGRTFESRGDMVMCGACGGKYFRIVSHLKSSRSCSAHLDLDEFEKQLNLYSGRKRKRKSDNKKRLRALCPYTP